MGIKMIVRLGLIKNALVRTYGDVLRNHTMEMAAALSYYFVLSLFPSLIFLSAVVAFLPVPDLFNRHWGLWRASCPQTAWVWCAEFWLTWSRPTREHFFLSES